MERPVYPNDARGRGGAWQSQPRTARPLIRPTAVVSPVTIEPAAPLSANAEQLLHDTDEQHPIRKQRRSVWRQTHTLRLRTLAIMACCLLLVGGAGIYYLFLKSNDPIPKSISSQVNFPLYYPSTLPKNWSLVKSSVYADASAKLVGYTLRGPKGNLIISIQPAPSNFDFNSFYTQRLLSNVQFLTPQGQGVVGRAIMGNQLIGSLLTTSSWVLASSSSDSVTQADIQFVLSHLQAASP